MTQFLFASDFCTIFSEHYRNTESACTHTNFLIDSHIEGACLAHHHTRERRKLGGKWRLGDLDTTIQMSNTSWVHLPANSGFSCVPACNSGITRAGSPHFREIFPSSLYQPSRCLLLFSVTLNSIMRHNGMNNYDLCIKIHLLCVHCESVYVCEAQTWFIHWISKQFSMMIVFQWSLWDYRSPLISVEFEADCFESKAHTRVHY